MPEPFIGVVIAAVFVAGLLRVLERWLPGAEGAELWFVDRFSAILLGVAGLAMGGIVLLKL